MLSIHICGGYAPYTAGLQKVKLVDAGFIWTEPHSKRLKTKLTIQKEVLNGKDASCAPESAPSSAPTLSPSLKRFDRLWVSLCTLVLYHR